jgi:alkylated DNA repair dioxygenase AlkB
MSFGLRYDYTRRMVEPAQRFPVFIEELRKKAAAFAGRNVDEILQAGVNQYPVGAGIGWHKDKPQFGVVIGISLLAPAIMRFRFRTDTNWIRKSRILEPRSIYILEGEARTLWEHSIPPVDSLRYSLTFRTLA